MTEPGDKVLVLDNGIYGKGFADFVSMYGGKPELYTRDYRNTLDVKELEDFLADNHDYKYATVVHGDTPSGIDVYKRQAVNTCFARFPYSSRLPVITAISP